MRLALRTLVEMNLDVSWIAISSSVRSPEAAAPSFCCSLSTCLGGVERGGFFQTSWRVEEGGRARR